MININKHNLELSNVLSLLFFKLFSVKINFFVHFLYLEQILLEIFCFSLIVHLLYYSTLFYHQNFIIENYFLISIKFLILQ